MGQAEGEGQNRKWGRLLDPSFMTFPSCPLLPPALCLPAEGVAERPEHRWWGSLQKELPLGGSVGPWPLSQLEALLDSLSLKGPSSGLAGMPGRVEMPVHLSLSLECPNAPALPSALKPSLEGSKYTGSLTP